VADENFAEQWPAGDRDEAIAALFRAEYRRLVNTAFAFVADWDLAEQLTQEAYLRLWRRWRWLRDPQAAPGYLRQTVLNLARNTIRRSVLERIAVERRPSGQAHDPAADPAGDIALRQAVATLPHRKRACIVLRYLVGMSESETAALLGVSVGTVKSQTHKALRLLRDQLGEQSAQSPQPAQRGASTSRSGRTPA
jgi:RNA polymerase sigma-70 factor (sigma-E family)